ncbi:GntR family transcriptional regulator [Methylacidiphilales bacterium]|nr:GntR family transcriptional regulator [Candidatus Methylacidiphilales bacterium]
MALSPVLTKQQVIYQHLKDQILEGKMPPGHRLVIDDIADDLGISIIPVREAMQLLQAERLVEIRPHAGATVAALTPESIEETFTILEGVEAMAVRRVARQMPEDLDAKLSGLIRQMDKAEKAHDVEKWSALNMEFHLALSHATGMPWLREITERALGNWDRIRRHFFREGAEHRFAEAQREHHALLKALGKGDADQAEKVIRQHNQRAFRHYSLTRMQKSPSS